MKRSSCVVAAAVFGILGPSGVANAALMSTTTALSPNFNPAYDSGADSSLILTATVTSQGSPVDEGSVAFDDGALVIAGCGAEAVTAGHATCDTVISSAGTYDLSATFSDDSDYASSTGYLTEVIDSHSPPAPVPAPEVWRCS